MTANRFNFTTSKLLKLECALDSKGKPKDTFYWDDTVRYLGVKVLPSGGRSFVFETWKKRNIRIKIGDVSDWSVAQARTEATRLKVLVDSDIDPTAEKKKKQEDIKIARTKGVTGLEVWQEYIKDRTPRWGERHRADHIEMARPKGGTITRGLRPNQSKIKQEGILHNLLATPLNELTRDQVSAWVKKESVERPSRARLALALLKAFIVWCGDHQQYRAVVNKDCCERLMRELPPRQAKDDCLQKEQLEAWFKGVKAIPNKTISAYLQILLLTGARRNELATIKWKDIDLRWNTATLRDKVDGERTIPITPYISHLLDQLPRKFVDNNDNIYNYEYVFAKKPAEGKRDKDAEVRRTNIAWDKYVVEPRIAHNEVLDEQGLPPLTIHGLRRSFSTLSEWVEVPTGVVAQIQGHKPSATAEKHYKRRPIDLLRKWHTKIEEFILNEAKVTIPKVKKAAHGR